MSQIWRANRKDVRKIGKAFKIQALAKVSLLVTEDSRIWA